LLKSYILEENSDVNMNFLLFSVGRCRIMVLAIVALMECVHADDILSVKGIELVRPATNGAYFVRSESGSRFVAWGFNYDHDASGRLIEDYWTNEWATVEEDFMEMKALGANMVRIHLQVAKFMKSPVEPDAASLERLERLIKLAELKGLYLDVTGLGCYRKQDVPGWYKVMDEADRWNVQAVFWDAVAGVCAKSPAIFCYDLMNEPILPGAGRKETEWLGGELGGLCFVQRITLDLAGRTREQVARKWVDKMAGAIRHKDKVHMITVGEIPWAHTFPGAKPFFSSKEVGAALDFTSVHFYPQKGEVRKALAALAVYDGPKPLIVEEIFPLKCDLDELDSFIEGSRGFCDGWVGFYWGRTIEDYSGGPQDIGTAITRGWLEYFRKKRAVIITE